jgi:hypothetical protein
MENRPGFGRIRGFQRRNIAERTINAIGGIIFVAWVTCSGKLLAMSPLAGSTSFLVAARQSVPIRRHFGRQLNGLPQIDQGG